MVVCIVCVRVVFVVSDRLFVCMCALRCHRTRRSCVGCAGRRVLQCCDVWCVVVLWGGFVCVSNGEIVECRSGRSGLWVCGWLVGRAGVSLVVVLVACMQ